MRQRKSEAVLESARTLFLAKGFDHTTVEEIAEAAQVSKATVYNNFPDKAAVLDALLDRVAVESSEILAGVIAPLHGEGDLEHRLAQTATALAHGVLRPEVLQLRRLAITESARAPRTVARYFDRGPGSTVRLLADALRDLHEQGLLDVPDPERSAAQFAYAAVGPLQDRAILGGETPSTATVERYATGAAHDFVVAHAGRRSASSHRR